MKKIIFAIICLGSAAAVPAQTNNPFPDENTRVSYAIGMMTGHTWQMQGVDFDIDTYAKGIKDGKSGGPTLLTTTEAQAAISQFKQEFQAKQQKLQAEKGMKAKADGESFLAANKVNPGIVTLPDGLQYQILTTGTGAMPAASDTVTVNYRGTLVDGTEFDSSYKRGQPASFPVGGVIRGWTEALQKMNVGSKWKLFIPSELAYGERGHPPAIPENSTLIFEVELLDVKTPAPAPQAAPVAPLTSDIIKVPSADEMKKGAKIEVIKPEDAAKAQAAGQQ